MKTRTINVYEFKELNDTAQENAINNTMKNQLIKNPVLITVERSGKGYGYQLRHNQKPGFKGIISNTWAWYKYKSDAEKAAIELQNCWNDARPKIEYQK